MGMGTNSPIICQQTRVSCFPFIKRALGNLRAGTQDERGLKRGGQRGCCHIDTASGDHLCDLNSLILV